MSCIGSINAGRFTNGFPNVLVADVFPDVSSNVTLRLIPEMNFTCNGTIVGFTVAVRRQPQSGMDSRISIQIWRQNSTQNISIYYKADVKEIGASCGETPIVFRSNNRVIWKCNLTATNRVPVQAGDILGLLLPPNDQRSFQLAFARGSRGPTNYVFEDQEVPSYQTVSLFDADSMNLELPQIAVQVESGICLSHCHNYVNFVISD